jgi:hypothetical protein
LYSKDLFTDGEGYLIMDKNTSHYDNDLIKKFTNQNKFISFIPSGLIKRKIYNTVFQMEQKILKLVELT